MTNPMNSSSPPPRDSSELSGLERGRRPPETAAGCPLKTDLVYLACGRLPPEEAALSVRHLRVCERCREIHARHENAYRRALRRPPARPGRPGQAPAGKGPSWVQRFPRAAAAAILLLVGATCTMGALHLSLFKKWSALQQAMGVPDYVWFLGEDAEHPSRDPGRARPLAVVGREILLQGKVRPLLIEKAILRVCPGLKGGGEEVVKVIEVPEDPDNVPVPLEARFEAPGDGQLRLVTLELIPRREAAEVMADKQLTYVVPVACQAAGPIAYASQSQGPAIQSLEQEGDCLVVKVQARSYEGSWVTIGSFANGGMRPSLSVPQRVSRRDEVLHFSVFVGAASSYEIQAYAMEAGEPTQLTDAIFTGKMADVLVGDRKKVKVDRSME